MLMRNDLRHWESDQIKGELQSRLPRHKVDIVHKCYNFGYGPNDLDWHLGEHPQLTQSAIEKPAFQTIVHECRSRAELLWAGGQSCILCVCICDHSTLLTPAIVVSSTLQAVFQHAGYNSIYLRPFELIWDYQRRCRR